MSFELPTLAPFVIGFFLVAAVATSLAVVALASLIIDRRRPAHPVVAISAAYPDAAAATRRAA